MINLRELLEEFREPLIDRAFDELNNAQLFHYDREKDKIRQRMAVLFDLMLRCIAEQCADPVVDHAKRLARDRFAVGYDLSEVQTSINILKEVVCARVVASLAPSEVAGALGVVNAIFSVTKDALACAYVDLTRNAE